MTSRSLAGRERGRVSLGIVGAVLVLLVLCAAFLRGCGDGIVSPGVRVSYRQALLRTDYVLTIVNSGSKPLFNVTVASDGWQQPVRVAQQLNVGSEVDAGWLELPEGCQRGRSYRVSADGYVLPARFTIPTE